jgi:CRISPR/Cas system-associated exonuclease Cas4 (RecB family)
MASRALKNINKLINLAVNVAPVGESFLLDLNMAIEKQDSANRSGPSSTGYNPSSIHCIRCMFYKAVGKDKDEDRATAELIGMGQVGGFRHERIQEAISSMKKFGVDCEFISPKEFIKSRGLDYLQVISEKNYETLVYHKALNLRFLTDGIIRYRKQYYILEIKTETIYKWQNRKEIEPLHIEQATCYSVSYGINQVLFLYENRDTLGKKAYVIEITDDMKQKITERIEICDQHVSKLKVPAKPADLPKKVCAYCAYKNICEKDGD